MFISSKEAIFLLCLQEKWTLDEFIQSYFSINPQTLKHSLQNKLDMFQINTSNILSNYQYFRDILSQNTKIMLMIKGNAYGYGAVEIAKLFQKFGVSYFGISHLLEGRELRQNNIKTPIMVISSDSNYFQQMVDYKLEPTIQDFLALKKINEVAKKNCLKNYPIHLKIDTGMHRAGFMKPEIKKLLKIMKEQKNKCYEIKSIYTHLSASEDPMNDEFTISQIKLFQKIYDEICYDLDQEERPLKHCLNSAGVERFPQYQFDMVRIGKGVLGFSAFSESKLKRTGRFKAPIIQLKQLSPNDGEVGYNRDGKLRQNKNTKIATISAGYTDGINFRLGKGKGKFQVKGKLAPTIGRICMDMCMIDVTDIEGVCERDEVTIFGDNPTIQQLANLLETKQLQILTLIGRRIERVYIQESPMKKQFPKLSDIKNRDDVYIKKQKMMSVKIEQKRNQGTGVV